jgi:hypothetical protein
VWTKAIGRSVFQRFLLVRDEQCRHWRLPEHDRVHPGHANRLRMFRVQIREYAKCIMQLDLHDLAVLEEDEVTDSVQVLGADAIVTILLDLLHRRGSVIPECNDMDPRALMFLECDSVSHLLVLPVVGVRRRSRILALKPHQFRSRFAQ